MTSYAYYANKRKGNPEGAVLIFFFLACTKCCFFALRETNSAAVVKFKSKPHSFLVELLAL